MLAVLSPAKSLNFTPAPSDLPYTKPEFSSDAAFLVERLLRLSPSELQSLMKLSERLAELNYARFQRFGHPERPLTSKPAALAFAGDSYIGLNAATLSRDDLLWAQDRLRILSGLYGSLRPLDLIEPHRLEMGTRFATERGEDLYVFWREKISASIGALAKTHAAPLVVVLASTEYARVLRSPRLRVRTIVPVFREETADSSRVVGSLAKRARGMMARFMIQNRLENPRDLQGFQEGGYSFRPAQSDETVWVFARPRP